MQDTTALRQPAVQSIQRAAAVLRELAGAPGGLTLAQLARAVALPKSTVHRLVAALADEQLAAHAPDGRIVLGGGMAALGAAAAETLAPRLHPLLEELAGELGETVDLAVLDGASVRFVDQVSGSQRLRAVSAVGAVFPLHCTANGKALLAQMSDEAALALLPRRLPRCTAKTIASRGALLVELEAVRRSGVAFDREEHSEGICAVGAAVRGPSGALCALSIPVPAARFHGR